jgi:nicotinamide-nucleotide amidase
MVRLRLTATGTSKESINSQLDALFSTLQQLTAAYLVINEDIPLDLAIGKLLLQKNATIATAESCTGGYIAHLLSQHAGASAYYKGSLVTYANQAKQDLLQVTEQTLQTVGAVSEETVIQMATHANTLLKTNYAIAVSGIMGPTGGTDTKPVGTVWVAVAGAEKASAMLLHLRFDRLRNIQLTAINALNFARKFILEND